MNRASTRITWIVVLIVALFGVRRFAHADEASQGGCLSITRIEADGPVCKAMVSNGCPYPLNLSVTYNVSTLGFLTRHIASPGLYADHHGEPAYGFYEGEERDTAVLRDRLAPGESKWFERHIEGRVIMRCEVSAVGRE